METKKPRPLNVGVVGATGVVGKTFLSLLEERPFPLGELRLFTSENSVGKKISVQGKNWTCEALGPLCFENLDLVFFSSGDEISQEWAPQAVASGAIAVDNSAAFRLHSEIDLVVPEVNGHLLDSKKQARIIANPNCSTIQLVMALKPLSDHFGLEEVRVSTYQAVSGAGQGGLDELLEQTENHLNKKKPEARVFPHPILFNVIPQIGGFNGDGYCSEEVKIIKETKKILSRPDLKVSAFTVRVPALNSHSETVWVTLKEKIKREKFIAALQEIPGLLILDEPSGAIYPTPREVSGRDPVYVGRIHRDPENPFLWLLWVVSDNLRKGAALNGIQIAERIFDIKSPS